MSNGRSTYGEILSIKDNVEKLLKDFPATRNSDKFLEYKYVTEVLKVKISFMDWNKLSSVNFDSITRARRKFQEEGYYLPTDPEILKQRRRYETEMHENMPRTSFKDGTLDGDYYE